MTLLSNMLKKGPQQVIKRRSARHHENRIREREEKYYRYATRNP